MEWDQIFVSLPRPLSLTNSTNSWILGVGGNFARFFLLVNTNTRAVVAMAEATSKRGRCYINGRPFQLDLRRKIVEDIVEDGGDFVTGFSPGNFSAIAERNRVKFDTVGFTRPCGPSLVPSPLTDNTTSPFPTQSWPCNIFSPPLQEIKQYNLNKRGKLKNNTVSVQASSIFFSG